jgi:hypothetical protein
MKAPLPATPRVVARLSHTRSFAGDSCRGAVTLTAASREGIVRIRRPNPIPSPDVVAIGEGFVDLRIRTNHWPGFPALERPALTSTSS